MSVIKRLIILMLKGIVCRKTVIKKLNVFHIERKLKMNKKLVLYSSISLIVSVVAINASNWHDEADKIINVLSQYPARLEAQKKELEGGVAVLAELEKSFQEHTVIQEHVYNCISDTYKQLQDCIDKKNNEKTATEKEKNSTISSLTNKLESLRYDCAKNISSLNDQITNVTHDLSVLMDAYNQLVAQDAQKADQLMKSVDSVRTGYLNLVSVRDEYLSMFDNLTKQLEILEQSEKASLNEIKVDIC